VKLAECEDEDDNDEAAYEDESNCQDVSSSVTGINDSASVSPRAAADHSDEEQELVSSKSKLPKSGLRIKLSLKPVRKSAREHKVLVSVSWLTFCYCEMCSNYSVDVSNIFNILMAAFLLELCLSRF